MLGDAPAMRANLRRLGVALGRHVARLFQQREVDVGFHVAGRTRVAVPVPGAAHVAAGLPDAHAAGARLLEAGRGQQAAEAAAQHQHVNRVVDRRAFVRDGVRVGQQVRKTLAHVDVLPVALPGRASLAFDAVAFGYGGGVGRRGRGVGHSDSVAGAGLPPWAIN